MMENWLPLAVFGLVIGGLMILLTRYQAKKYQTYLDRHVAVSAEIKDNQHRLIAQQEQAILAAERQAAALERIAASMDNNRA